MGNVYMEAEQVRFKDSTYHNLQTAVKAALEGGGGGGTTVIANPEGSATDDLSKLQVGTTIYGIPAEAGDISYDNTSSGMAADDVQGAIDELSADIPGLATTEAAGIVQPDGETITIEDGVISAVGGSGSGETYSTEETLIGSWLGAPLYRKSYPVQSMPDNSTLNVPTGLSGVAYRRCYGEFLFSNGSVSEMPYAEQSGSTLYTMSVSVNPTNNNFTIVSNYDASASSGIVHIEYTKNA